MPRDISPAISTAPSTSPTVFTHEREEDDQNIDDESGSRTTCAARSLSYLRETIPPRSLTAPLLFISLACGILDATTYADFGTFASNQTGNTLILTLLLTSTPTPSSSSTNSPHILPTGVSLLSFLLFGFTFGHIGHYFGARRRAWWLASLTMQVLAVLIPGVLMALGVVRIAGQGGEGRGSGSGNGKDWLVLGLLAAGAGAQVGMARTSSNPEIPSAMLTSPLIDLLTDGHLFLPLFHPLARARNVRTLYVIALVGGSFLGAGIHKWGGTETVMWVSVGLRVVVVGWVGFIKGEVTVAEGKSISSCLEAQNGRIKMKERKGEEPSRREVEPGMRVEVKEGTTTGGSLSRKPSGTSHLLSS